MNRPIHSGAAAGLLDFGVENEKVVARKYSWVLTPEFLPVGAAAPRVRSRDG